VLIARGGTRVNHKRLYRAIRDRLFVHGRESYPVGVECLLGGELVFSVLIGVGVRLTPSCGMLRGAFASQTVAQLFDLASDLMNFTGQALNFVCDRCATVRHCCG
jgi:hypothetical protein